MFSQDHPNFHRMDKLSQRQVPYFFMIDFLMEDILIFEKNELLDSEILIDFKSFKNISEEKTNVKEVRLNSYPESAESYKKGFDLVQKNLKLGNSYLTNYTCKTEIEVNLTLNEIFYQSKAKYKVLYKDKFLFFSPETFINIENQRISTQPMKGTIDASLKNARDILRNDPKEKAEHYTVVDLLRNDLSIVANEVQVEEFQRIDYIQSAQKNLFAMSSEIVGKIKPEFQNKIGSIMKTILPAGSILGAPKQKTWEIILEAENYNRGFYTGVCGYFDGENLDSCVMIRFIEKENEKLFFKSGGGITHLSKFADEYAEMQNKIYVPIH